MKRLLKSFRYACEGIRYTLFTQPNMKVHLGISILVLVLTLVLDVNRLEILILFLTIGAVLAAECFNTALESAVDLVTTEFHPLAKIAKDAAAGAVFVMALNSVVVGCILFGPKLFPLQLRHFHELSKERWELACVAVVLLIFGTLFIWSVFFKSQTGGQKPVDAKRFDTD